VRLLAALVVCGAAALVYGLASVAPSGKPLWAKWGEPVRILERPAR
jgi:hypothetical protein